MSIAIEAIPQLSELPSLISDAVMYVVPLFRSRVTEMSLQTAFGIVLSFTVTVKLQVADNPNASSHGISHRGHSQVERCQLGQIVDACSREIVYCGPTS